MHFLNITMLSDTIPSPLVNKISGLFIYLFIYLGNGVRNRNKEGAGASFLAGDKKHEQKLK